MCAAAQRFVLQHIYIVNTNGIPLFLHAVQFCRIVDKEQDALRPSGVTQIFVPDDLIMVVLFQNNFRNNVIDALKIIIENAGFTAYQEESISS